MTSLTKLIYLPWWWFKAAVLGKHYPLQSVIFISDRCNLSCKHCSVYNHTAPIDKTFEQIRSELEYCYSLGSRFVDFEGGEPFIWRDGDKTVNDLCRLARQGGGVAISSMCTVFAESEVISLIGRGEARENIAFAVVDSVVQKVSAQAGKLSGGSGTFCLTGVLCQCDFICEALEKALGRPVQTCENGRFAGALGAALSGLKKP